LATCADHARIAATAGSASNRDSGADFAGDGVGVTGVAVGLSVALDEEPNGVSDREGLELDAHPAVTTNVVNATTSTATLRISRPPEPT
jgi:hypothetical protein